MTRPVRLPPGLALLALLALSPPRLHAQEAGGPAWQQLYNNPEPDGGFDGVFFLTPDTGWIVSRRGFIYRTDDSGLSWRWQLNRPSSSFGTIGFADERRGWAGNPGPGTGIHISDSTLIYRTTDGGESWTPTPRPRGPVGVETISVVDSLHVFACGRSSGPAYLLKTADGGRSWDALDLSAHLGSVTDCRFTTPDSGIVAGGTSPSISASRGVILSTADGGRSWETRYRSAETNDRVLQLSFPTDRVGYALMRENPEGEALFLEYLKTTDGGSSWERHLLGAPGGQPVRAIGFVSPERGWMDAWATSDGARSWRPGGFVFRRMHTVSDTFAVAVGDEIFRYSPTILRDRPPFSILKTTLPGVRHGALGWGDFDRDGDLDLVLTGLDAGGMPITRAYRNHGQLSDGNPDPAQRETWLELENLGARAALLEKLGHSAAAPADVDGDGDADLLLTGSTATDPLTPATRLYLNQFEVYQPDRRSALVDVHSGAAAWADYDRDGDPDLFLCGVSADGYVSRLYRNDGTGRLTDSGVAFPGLAFGSADWADYDGDGDPDLLLTGETGVGFRTRLYRNDGPDAFTPVGTGLPGVGFGTGAWGDYDADGDPDILLTGGVVAPGLLEGRTRLYRNDDGLFVEEPAGFHDAVAGAGLWADYDLDGDLDAAVVGASELYGTPRAVVYQNVDGRFEPEMEIAGVSLAAVAWQDYNGDGDPDLLVTGLSASGEQILLLYRNDRFLDPDLDESD